VDLDQLVQGRAFHPASASTYDGYELISQFQSGDVWCLPNIQLLIHLFIIWSPGKGQPLAFFIADLTHQYSEVVSVLKL
jgi:hypothetical protein